MKDGNGLDLGTLVCLAEGLAKKETDGHIVIMRFTTGWKVALGTPDLDTDHGREQVSKLPKFDTLNEALSDLIMQRRNVNNL